MNKVQGSLSINSENIFPIIKKWLYSDHDIFYRELVSNGCDAITKLKKLSLMSEVELDENEKFKLDVIVDSNDKTIKIIDNGIGMTADEVKEYINQIAFSGAEAFLEKYKDKTNEDQIIGHFGLGFYSAFMVADKVTIDTLSWQKGASAVHWESEGGTEFEMTDSDKTTRGTEITLYLHEDSYEVCNEYRAREVLEKYCSFMPVEIYLTNAAAAKEEKVEAEDKGPKPINETLPLWAKHPNECTDEEYKEFYRNVFHDYKEPLFWIHLNMDYPFNLKGILYFPKVNTEYDNLEGTIKLYNNQVFIADNIKEVIPEFLMLLKGAIDCPDLPLNVSRSALQNDGFVRKISDYITKKVADKLSGICKTDRESYEKYWDDINPFIKFGCLKDPKFEEKMRDYIIFKNLDGKYITLSDYNKDFEATKDNKKIVYYVTDEQQQSQYINMFKDAEIDAVILKHNIDQPFVTSLEQRDETIKFQRIDSDITDSFKEEINEADEEEMKKEAEALTELFRKVLNEEKLDVKVEKLKNENVSSMVTLSEESRRMQDMMKMYNMGGMDPSMFGTPETLVLNSNNKLVQYVFKNKESDDVNIVCEQLYDLAMISHKPLQPEKMTKFIERSNKILTIMINE